MEKIKQATGDNRSTFIVPSYPSIRSTR